MSGTNPFRRKVPIEQNAEAINNGKPEPRIPSLDTSQ